MFSSSGVMIWSSRFDILVSLDLVFLSFTKGWTMFIVSDNIFTVTSACLQSSLILVFFSNTFSVMCLKVLKLMYLSSFFESVSRWIKCFVYTSVYSY